MHADVRLSPHLLRGVAFALAVALGSGCAATPPARLRTFPTETGTVVNLADVRLAPGSECVVGLRSGETIRGRLVAIEVGAIVLDAAPYGDAVRPVADADITSIGRVVGRSKPRRGGIGALAGAVLSLPLSMSMPGDAILVGGLIGNLLGRATGDSRVEIVLAR
jgi:hypothetical protein